MTGRDDTTPPLPAPPRIAYVLPTRDRPRVLAQTLDALGVLPRHDAQVIVVDNASASATPLPGELSNGLPVSLVPLRSNAGAAARNAGVMISDPSVEWIVMLDDDSAPVDLGHLAALAAARRSTVAVAAEIHLPSRTINGQAGPGPRESGGLPEVFIGCGVAIRREAFIECGGYDAAFNYYAEEYDLAARFIAGGGRIAMDRRFRVLHRKVAGGRDMNLILGRLVRNNGWVMQRYAPERRRIGELRHIVDRYRAIAVRERAETGYRAGLAELAATLREQARTPLSPRHWARFTGAAAARRSLERAWVARGFGTFAIVDEGKNAQVIRRELRAMGLRETDERSAEALVIGTLSPGPMLDAWEARRGDPRIVAPWDEILAGAGSAGAVAA